MQAFPLFAIATPGLEPLLATECRELGIDVLAVERGAVSIAPGGDTMARANLELRTASRVLVRAAEFSARLMPELERRSRRLPWERFLAPGATIRFRVTSRKSRLYHQGAIAERLGAAASAAVGAVTADGGDDPDEDGPAPGAAQLIVVRVIRDQFIVSFDTSGDLLHRRGYRLAGARAPLRETIAAAMLRASGWDGRAPLTDPFAGSGTIPIEAAMIARRIAPGLDRPFAFERWPEFDANGWRTLIADARGRMLPRAPGPIFGFDRDAGSIAAAQANAERAGVAGDVRFETRAISALPPYDEPGHLIANPPYGIRMGDRRSLRNLFARFGAVATARCPGSTLTVLLAAPEHQHAIGLRLADRFQTTSGGVAVRCVSGPIVPQAPGVSPA